MRPGIIGFGVFLLLMGLIVYAGFGSSLINSFLETEDQRFAGLSLAAFGVAIMVFGALSKKVKQVNHDDSSEEYSHDAMTLPMPPSSISS